MVRSQIDQIDRQIVALLAERGGYVKQAARFKKTTGDVKAPQRVEQVIAKLIGFEYTEYTLSDITDRPHFLAFRQEQPKNQ